MTTLAADTESKGERDSWRKRGEGGRGDSHLHLDMGHNNSCCFVPLSGLHLCRFAVAAKCSFSVCVCISLQVRMCVSVCKESPCVRVCVCVSFALHFVFQRDFQCFQTAFVCRLAHTHTHQIETHAYTLTGIHTHTHLQHPLELLVLHLKQLALHFSQHAKIIRENKQIPSLFTVN